MIFKNIIDAAVPYFEGRLSLEEAASDVSNLFLRTFEANVFICERCGETVFPEVIMNEHGIFIESSRTETRGGKGNYCIKKNICEKCARRINMKG